MIDIILLVGTNNIYSIMTQNFLRCNSFLTLESSLLTQFVLCSKSPLLTFTSFRCSETQFKLPFANNSKVRVMKLSHLTASLDKVLMKFDR